MRAHGSPDFSIITPSLNDLGYLKRACASVADQGEVTVEHLVVDGGSTDGSREWLAGCTDVSVISRQDGGMYEALNAGIERAAGTWVGFLNCDEQYLPGTLAAVAHCARRHRDAGLISGDMLVIRPDGELLCHRREIPPRAPYIRVSYLYTFTCVLFFRRDMLIARFDTAFKAAGDEDLVLRLLPQVRVVHLRRYLAAFVDRPEALGRSDIAAHETLALRKRNPRWIALLAPMLRAARHLEKTLAGGYRNVRDLEYELFVGGSETSRRRFFVPLASWRWGRR